MKQVDVVIGLVMRRGDVLICRRKSTGPLPGYWEFPGGKLEPGESLENCLHRELDEELAIRVRIATPLSIIEHDYPDVRVRLHPFLCHHTAGEPQPLACDEVRWIAPSTLKDYRFPPANDTLLAEAITHLHSPTEPPTG